MNDLKKLHFSWNDKNSSIYLTKNWKKIFKYGKVIGWNLSENEIKNFIEKQKVSQIQYKNIGSQKIAQTGKSFGLRARFGSIFQGDLMFLSKKYGYGSASKYLMVIVESLSRWIFVEPMYSTKFDQQKTAFLNIYERMKKVIPNLPRATLISDGGSEWKSIQFKNLLQSLNFKQNIVKLRQFRYSKGATGIESTLRRVRHKLESVFMHEKKNSFREKLLIVENACNNEIVSSLGISPREAIENHTPLDVLMISNSRKLKKRKFLMNEMLNQKEIPLFSIIKVVLFTAKQFTGSRKESYSIFSPYRVVVEINKSRDVWTYKIANIFTWQVIDAEYSKAEIRLCNINFIDACRKEEKLIKKIVKYSNDLVYYEIFNCNIVFCANRSLIMND